MTVARKIVPLLPIMISPNREYKLTPIEGDPYEICKKLDLSCGIDYLLDIIKPIKGDSNTFAVGCRVQPVLSGQTPFNTFTIRNWRESGAKTEFDKLKYAVSHDTLRPNLTMHIFYDKDNFEILSAAIARTVDIVNYIEEGNAYERETNERQIGHSKFWVVDWKVFKHYTNTFYVYTK